MRPIDARPLRAQTPYYGGLRECDVGIEGFAANTLVCSPCQGLKGECAKHGTEYIEYKCRYCCSVAVFFCHVRPEQGRPIYIPWMASEAGKTCKGPFWTSTDTTCCLIATGP